jgi:hypothetical protein
MSNTLNQLKRAKEIVDRYLERGRVFPRELRDCGRTDPVRQQEYRDACKIKTWKYSLMGKNRYSCSDEVRDYLDENMPGWRNRVYSHNGRNSTVQLNKAKEIVRRYRERGFVLPRRINDPNKEQEFKDAVNLCTWRSSLKGKNRVTCSSPLREYLDENLPGWRDDFPFDNQTSDMKMEGSSDSEPPLIEVKRSPTYSTADTMPIATGIVQRYKERGNVLPSLKAECRNDPSRAQECKDAGKLHSWKIHTTEKLTPEVLQYLDTEMPGWKKSSNANTIPRSVQQKQNPLYALLMKAREIVQRCQLRRIQGQQELPRHFVARQDSPQLMLEQRDALKLSDWKRAALRVFHSSGGDDEKLSEFPVELKDYLDRELSGWFSIDCESPYTFPQTSKGMSYLDSVNSENMIKSSSNLSKIKSEKQKSDTEAERVGVAALLQLSRGNSPPAHCDLINSKRSSDDLTNSSPSSMAKRQRHSEL